MDENQKALKQKETDIYRQMPRDYSKTIIYRIPVGDENYYGHTTTPLHKRKSDHIKRFNSNNTRKVYQAIRDAGMTSNDIELVWVENHPCNNIYEAKARERHWIEKKGTLNMIIPNRTNNEWKRHKRATDDTWRQTINTQLKERYNALVKNNIEAKAIKNMKERERHHRLYTTNEEYRQSHLKRCKEHKSQLKKCDDCGKEMRRDSIKRHRKQSCKGKTS